MSKKLKNILGIDIPDFNLELTRVGELTYFDGPLTSVHKDNFNSPYIFDWAEADETHNRWLVYQIEKETLEDYIFGRISHYTLINTLCNDLLFIVDKNQKGEVSNCKITSLKNIPNNYLPKSTIYFDEYESIGLEKIINSFELKDDNSSKQKIKKFNILEEAIKNDCEIINLHIKSENSKVGYGKIRSSILGEVLTNYNKLSQATALNLYDLKGKLPKEEKIRRKKGELEKIKELGETEFMYAKAASFSVFLKPIKESYTLFEDITSSQHINNSIFELFEASTNTDKLNDIKEKLNEGMLASYNNLLKEIKEQDITLLVQYANPKTNILYQDTFDSKKAFNILKNLDKLEVENNEEVKTKGIFKALDSLNYTFKFESFDEEIYIGKFSDIIKLGIFNYNLLDVYNVSFEVNQSKKSGQTNFNEKTTMVSCVKTS